MTEDIEKMVETMEKTAHMVATAMMVETFVTTTPSTRFAVFGEFAVLDPEYAIFCYFASGSVT